MASPLFSKSARLTYRIIKEICNAAGELARFPAPFSSVLPDLFVAGDDTHEIHSLAPSVATGESGANLSELHVARTHEDQRYQRVERICSLQEAVLPPGNCREMAIPTL